MDFSPTLLIGLGPTGELVLRRIKKNLLDRSRGAVLNRVQFLWIGTDKYSGASPGLARLDAGEEILIQPDPAAFQKHLDASQERKTTCAWWNSAAGYARIRGRMAYFYETQFNPSSLLKSRFHQIKDMILTPSDRNFRVLLITSSVEEGGAILFDLAHEIRTGELSDRVTDLIPWIFMIPAAGDRRTDSMRGMNYAFMRELQRFMTGGPKVLDHGCDTRPYGVYDQILFDRAFVFDQPAAHIAVADQITVLTERSIADTLYSRLRDGAVQTSVALPLYISASSSFTFMIPIAEIHAFCAAQLAFDTLFRNPPQSIQNFGLQPVERGRQGLEFPRTDRSICPEVKEFLSTTLEHNQYKYPPFPFNYIDQISGQVPTKEITGSLVDTFRQRLQFYLTDRMRERGKSASSLGPLGWADQFLSDLEKVFDTAWPKIYQSQQADPVSHSLVQAYPALKAVLKEFQKQMVDQWKPALTRLHSQLIVNINQARDNLKAVLEPSRTRAVIRSSRAQARDNPGNYYYNDQVVLPQGAAAVNRLQSDLTWEWMLDPQNKMLLVLSLNGKQFTAADFLEGSSRFAEEWSHMAHDLSMFIRDNISLTNQMDAGETAFRPGQLPLLLSQQQIPDPNRQSFKIFAGSDPAFLNQWIRENALGGIEDRTCLSGYTDWLTVIQFTINCSYETARLISEDHTCYTGNDLYHCFPAEQHACQIEREIQNMRISPSLYRRGRAAGLSVERDLPENFSFSPAFVSLMTDTTAFTTVMKLLFLDWVKIRSTSKGTAAGEIHTQPVQAALPDEYFGADTRDLTRLADAVSIHYQPGIEDLSDPSLAGHTQTGAETSSTLRIIPIELPDQGSRDLETVVRTILIHYPYLSTNNASPLHGRSFSKTIQQLHRAADQASRDTQTRNLVLREIPSRIRGWQEQSSPFYRDLAVYQTYLYFYVRNNY